MISYKKIFSILALAAAFVVLFATTSLEKKGVPLAVLLGLKVFLLLLNIFLLNFILYSQVIKKPQLNKRVKNAAVGLWAFLVLFLVLEGFFIFYPASHGFEITLASKRWYDYYWKPVNQLLYRDRLIQWEVIKNKRKVFCVGDSFTAGAGLRDARKRFSDQLALRLPEQYQVMNMGRRGNNTATEIYRLINFPIKPQVVIFQYFANDIEGVNETYVNQKDITIKAPRPVRIAIEHSYLLNYLYWYGVHQFPKDHVDILASMYGDRALLTRHLQDIRDLIRYCQKENIELVAVLFPFLSLPEERSAFLNVIREMFARNHVAVVYVPDVIRDIPLAERVVSKYDGHPSARVHEAVADEIFSVMKRNGMVR